MTARVTLYAFKATLRVRLATMLRTFEFKLKDQVEFIEYMNTWLDAGATPLQAAKAIMGAYPARSVQYKAARHLSTVLHGGGSLADGMKTWFHPAILTICDAGQRVSSEALAEGLRLFVKQEGEKKVLKEEFFKPIKGPAILIFFASLLFFIVGRFVVPTLTDEDARLPFMASLVTNVSGFFANFGLVLVVSGVVGAFFGYFFIKHSTHPWRLRYVDWYFPGALFRDFIAARFVSVLSLLVRYGQTPLNAATLMTRYATGYEKFHLAHLIRSANGGEQRLYRLLDSGIFSQTSHMRLRILAEAPGQSGKEKALSQLANTIFSDIRVAMHSIRFKCLIFLYIFLIFVIVVSVSAIVQLLAVADIF